MTPALWKALLLHLLCRRAAAQGELPPSEYTQPGAPSRKSVKDAVQMVENSVLAIHGSIKQDYEDLVKPVLDHSTEKLTEAKEHLAQETEGMNRGITLTAKTLDEFKEST